MEEKIFGNVAIRREGRTIRMILSGDADMDFVNAFSQTVTHLEGQRDHRPFVVDLSRVRYIDSAALTVFVRLIKISRGMKKKIILLGANDTLEKTFSYTGLKKLVDFCPSEDDLNLFIPQKPAVKKN